MSVAALLSACSSPGEATGSQASGSGSGSPSGSASGRGAAAGTGQASGAGANAAAGPSVDDAAQLVYVNRYDEADRAYSTLVETSPGGGDAHAGYAIFLAYRLDLTQALVQARAAIAAAPGSSRAWAALTRVDDWSDDVVNAVSSGHRAVELDPADPLAHIYDSEALGDHGQIADARAELAAARALLTASSPAYERAEVEREAGNLARDAGDPAGELAGFQRAAAVQPGWVERQSELAGAYGDNHDAAAAARALHAALALAPADARVLRSLGDAALLQFDYEEADAAFGRLAVVSPGDAGALTIAAHVRMAHTGDVDAGVALLEQALTADPADMTAAAYLLALERYVRGDEARGRAELAAAVAAYRDDLGPRDSGGHPPVPDVDGVEASDQQRALAAVNAARARAGLRPVVLDPHLGAAAVRHCWYWLFNNASDSVRDLGIHDETPGLPAFSGVRAGDRAEAQGWHSGPLGEDITHRGDPVKAVADWVDSVYHRFPIMRGDLTAVGFGDCGVADLPMEDLELGFGGVEGAHHPMTVYPGDGQTAVPATFVDNELPDPVPPGHPRTTGYPVTATFDARISVQVSTFTLIAPGGRAVDAYRLDPGPATENSASLLPVVPLSGGATYTAHIAGTGTDGPFDRTWRFTVA
ncbi:MAG TPA: CAP domain-containing protein [Candidatus Dormibacteraeota bacterium]|nr:CAP domain-containing protein [Candidatus Dormibacteraeota bacterium]